MENNTDCWVTLYGTNHLERPTGPLCDGGQSVNHNVATKRVTKWNVGCGKCNGPGRLHVARTTRESIVNPTKLDFVRGIDTCIQCHSQGQPMINPIASEYFDWPVSYEPGKKLQNYWKLEGLRPG